MSRMRGDPGQDVGQPGLRVDAVHRFNVVGGLLSWIASRRCVLADLD